MTFCLDTTIIVPENIPGWAANGVAVGTGVGVAVGGIGVGVGGIVGIRSNVKLKLFSILNPVYARTSAA